MAFNRIVELNVGTQNSGVLISGLDMSFDIKRSRKLHTNTAVFKIHNATQDTISRVLKKGNSVMFKAGYQDEGLGLIYSGQILDSVSEKIYPGTLVTLSCGSVQSSDTPLTSIVMSLSYKKESPLRQVVEDAANTAGLSVEGLSIISNVKLPNGFSFTGTLGQLLSKLQDVLARYENGVTVDNNVLLIYSKTAGKTATAVTLTSETGLITASRMENNVTEGEEDSDFLRKRVKFKSLLNYKISPDRLVVIKFRDIDNTYIVDKCAFKGDNYGGDFVVNGEGLGNE